MSGLISSFVSECRFCLVSVKNNGWEGHDPPSQLMSTASPPFLLENSSSVLPVGSTDV